MRDSLPVHLVFGILCYLTKDDTNHYAIHSLLCLRTLREKYVKMYEEFSNQLCVYVKAIRILMKDYLPISLLPPSKLQEILGKVRKTIQTMNPDYDIVIKRLHLHYDMKLITFGIDKDKSLIIQFSGSVQPYTQQPLILYQIKTVPVPIVDKINTHMQIDRPYIALTSETYILIIDSKNVEHQEIAYKFYCEELFLVKQLRYSCKVSHILI